MSRPKHLNTNSDFSVLKISDNHYALVYKLKYIVEENSSRNRLYTERARYSSWFKTISYLLKREERKDVPDIYPGLL